MNSTENKNDELPIEVNPHANSEPEANDTMKVEINAEPLTKKKGQDFDPTVITEYPNGQKKISVHVAQYGAFTEKQQTRLHTNYITPHGIEFTTAKPFDKGNIVKINVMLPDYWQRKQNYVDYGRIDRPKSFRVIGKVINVKAASDKGRKKNIMVQLLNIDDVDERILKEFIAE